jgi:glycosyltransferase involved in cell wall biosynthesis
MKICLVTEDFLPNIGGMSQHVYEIARCLLEMGNQVTIINLVLGNREEKVEFIEGIRVVRASFDSRIRKIRILPYSIKLRKLIHAENHLSPIDVIHWHDLRAGLAIKYASLPAKKVFTNHSSSFLLGLSSRGFRAYYRYTLAHADVLLAPSGELKQRTEEVVGKPTVYIPNGFDPSRFYPQDATDLRRRLGLEPNTNVLLVPRRLAPKNGVFDLAVAFPDILRSHPNTRIVITGGGFPDERARIEAALLAGGCLDKVLFMDGIDNREMPKYYSMADLIVIPSLMEAVSLAALESMATQKCVVASDVGGLSQIFSGLAIGRLVPPADPLRLGREIVSLLSDALLRDQLAKNARQHVLENYTWKTVAEMTIAQYK